MKQLAFAGRPSPAAAIFFPMTEHDIAAKFQLGRAYCPHKGVPYAPRGALCFKPFSALVRAVVCLSACVPRLHARDPDSSRLCRYPECLPTFRRAAGSLLNL
jgi:hypothetical protein